MPEDNNPEKDKPGGTEGNSKYIRQKILKKPLSGRKIFFRILKLVLSGVIFGAVAIVTAILAKPYAEKYLGVKASSQAETVSIPKDEPATVPATEAVPATENTVQAPSEAETQPVEEQVEEQVRSQVEKEVKSAMDNYHYSMKDASELLTIFRDISNKADYSVTAVNSVKKEKDWFDNSVQTSGLYSGIVTARTDRELLILTTAQAVKDADSLKVTFSKGQEMSAVQKKTDSQSGLAMLSVPITNENRSSLSYVVPVSFGNSYQVKRGDPLVFVGSPLGIVHSAEYGFASFIAENITVTDGTAGVIYSAAKGNAQDGTWVLNTDGKLVGWVTNAFRTDNADTATAVMGISDFKGILERMSNGQASPLIGIRTTAVTYELQKQGMPEGLYVISVTNDGPAYKAGIQPGDIITKAAGTKVATIKDYKGVLEKLHAEDAVPVTVMRNGRDSYAALEFQITAGAR